MAKNHEGLYVKEIHHKVTFTFSSDESVINSHLIKALMTVDEVGVEATGATGISITLYAFFPADVELVLDQPFLAFIVNRDKKTILFAGKVEDPTRA